MRKPATREEQLERQLTAAQQRIRELEDAMHPLRHKDKLQYRIQDSLLEDISNLVSLINSTDNLVWFLDHNKRLLLANEAMVATFKKTRGVDIEIGMSAADFLPAAQADHYNRIFAAALKGKTLRLRHVADTDRKYSATIQPVKKDDNIIGVSVFAQDMTLTHQLQDKLRRFEQIIASTPDLVALIDKDYRYCSANDAYLTAFETTENNLLGRHIKEILGAGHFDELSAPQLEKAFSGELARFEAWVSLPAHGRRFMSVAYHPLQEQSSHPDYVVINAHDITALRQAEEDRQRIFEVSLDMLAILDLDGTFKELNPAWQKTLGWSAAELKDQSWLDLVIPADREQSVVVGKRLAQGESVVAFENRYSCQDGSFKWLSWSSFTDRKQQRIFAAVRDITNRRRLEDELRKLATTDSLTGASNRRHFIECAEAELKRSKRYGSQMAVFMLDIDHFKVINDTHGHNSGDEVLKRLVDCCRQELRGSDIFGRFGGEEFAAVLVETNQSDAQRTCERLRRQIAGLRVSPAADRISITASIGLTMHMAGDISIDSLLKRADAALYQAKKTGRNRVVCY